jgi:hypothetical protein
MRYGQTLALISLLVASLPQHGPCRGALGGLAQHPPYGPLYLRGRVCRAGRRVPRSRRRLTRRDQGGPGQIPPAHARADYGPAGRD